MKNTFNLKNLFVRFLQFISLISYHSYSMDINLVPILSESKKLLKAIKYNDAELVIQILKTNPSLCNIYAHDTLAKKKIFPLHLAAVYGCTDCLTILLQQKIDVNMITRTGDTPLHCSRSNASTLLLLNEKRADIHKKNYSGKTAFFYSVLPIVKNEASYDQRSYKTARTLLEKGAKIDVADCHGNTVLHTAVLHKDYNAIYFLLQHGASPHKRNKKTNSSAFTEALKGQDQKTLNIFARFSHIFFPQGAIFYKNPYSLPELSHCIFNGKTPLHAAVKADNAEAIRLLIESGTNFMIPNQHGQTPIEYAIALKKEKSIAVFNTILINQLFDAAIIHDYPRFKELLVQIPNMNTTFDTYNFHKPFDAYNTTLLSELVPLPSKEGFIALLIKAGANVNTCIKYENGDKIFPLHIAVNRASTAVCKMLLDAGARPNTKSVCPLLSLALGKNIDKKIELIQLLIKYGTLVKKHHINMEHSIPRSIQRASSCYGDQYLMELKRFLQQTMDTQQCCICYENVNDMYDIPCKNRHINSFVCSVCYPALHKICPLCRAEIGEYGS